MLKVAKAQPPPLLVQGLTHQLPFRNASVEGVYTVALFHHLIEPWLIVETINEMVRVTKPGGTVILWDHNALNPYWPHLMRRLPQDAEGVRLVPLSEILRTVRTLPAVARVEVKRTGAIPEFLPAWCVSWAAYLERVVEAIPIVRNFLAHNVVILSMQHPQGDTHVAR